MSNLHKILIINLMFLIGFSVKAQEKIEIGTKTQLFSKILNENREVWIHLPKSYDDKDISPAKYPVIYLLDAEINFEYFAPTVDYLSRNPYADIPECIVVGIKNTKRTRDLTPTKSSKKNPNKPSEILFEDSGESDKFAQFIATELKPFISQNFRTVDFSILVGHSFGGLFTIDLMLKNPDSFNAFVANDPSLWWDNNIEITKLREFLKLHPKKEKPIIFYLAKANNGNERNGFSDGKSDSIFDFKSLISESGPFNFGYKYYEEDAHGTVSYPANYDGLRFIFKGFKTDIKEIAKKPEMLENDYAKFSKKVGFTFIPSEKYLNSIIGFTGKNSHQEITAYFRDLKEKLYHKN